MKNLFFANALAPRRLLFLILGLLLLACGGLGSGGIPDETPTPLPSATDTATAAPVTPTRTVTSQTTDVIPLETPTTTPSATPTETPTPASGIVEGRVEYQQYPDNTTRPDTGATVEMVGDTTSSTYFTTGTNAEGRYRLTDVPPGYYWLFARSSIGSSNPQDVEVNAGEITMATLSTAFSYIPYVFSPPRAAGGYVLVDGQPVAGATVWRFGGQIDTNTRAITDETGYFSFPYLEDKPIIAVYGDHWTVTTLEPNAVIDIELDRTGPHPTMPTGPVVTPIPVDEDVEIVVPTPPVIIPPRWTPEIRIIIPARPGIVRPTRLAIPTVGIREIATVAPPLRVTLQRPAIPTLAAPRLTVPSRATPTIPTACGQAKSNINYGPIRVGSTVILGRQEPVKKIDNWDKAMEKFVDSKATVIRLAGLDAVGCPLVRVDVDDGQFLWRIRAMTLIEP